MIEDESFNAFLKDRLEEGVVVPEVKALAEGSTDLLVGSRFRFAAWLRPVLLAASVAVVCGLFAWQLVNRRAARLEHCAVQTIEFLEECDMEDPDSLPAELDASDTFAEKLMAWQDAPFAEISS